MYTDNSDFLISVKESGKLWNACVTQSIDEQLRSCLGRSIQGISVTRLLDSY